MRVLHSFTIHHTFPVFLKNENRLPSNKTSYALTSGFYFLNSGNSVAINNAQTLLSTAYETELEKLISSSTPLTTENVQDCLSGRGIGFYVPDVKE